MKIQKESSELLREEVNRVWFVKNFEEYLKIYRKSRSDDDLNEVKESSFRSLGCLTVWIHKNYLSTSPKLFEKLWRQIYHIIYQYITTGRPRL